MVSKASKIDDGYLRGLKTILESLEVLQGLPKAHGYFPDYRIRALSKPMASFGLKEIEDKLTDSRVSSCVLIGSASIRALP